MSISLSIDSGIGAAAEVDRAGAHPLVEAAGEHSRARLRPHALRTDAEGVGWEHIAELTQLGLLNHLASAAYGGASLSTAEDRRIHEHIASGCLNTWLVWAQHASLARRIETALQGTAPRHELVDALLRGRVLAGAALSDVRRYPDRFIEAERTSAGAWTFSGTISWVSGWGLNTVLLVAAIERATERVVLALVPVGDRFSASELPLAALGGSRTARVRLDDVVVDDALVIATQPLAKWRRADRSGAVDAKPQLFGLASAVLDELSEEPSPLAQSLAERWTARIAALRARAYVLADDPDATALFDERLDVRIQTGEALTALTRGLLVARAGRSLHQGDTAQYYLRSAHFLLVQSQTDVVRSAQLQRLMRA